MITKIPVEEKTEMTEEEKIDIMSTPVPKTEGNKIYVDDEEEVVEDSKDDDKAKKVEEKKEEVVVEEKKSSTEDFMLRLEREMAKDDGKEDLKDWTPTEKAYYHQMRRDRKARQRAERELEELKFNNIKLKQAKETKPVEEEEEEDPFKDRAPDDLLTVEDIKKLLAVKKPKKEEKIERVETTAQPVIDINNPATKKFLDLCDKEAKQTYEDYEEVVELTREIITNNSSYQERIARCFQEGRNPAIEIYDIIKSDAEFEKLYPVAQTRVKARKQADNKPVETEKDSDKEKKAQEAQEALEKNKNKVKTSAHAAGSESSDELTFDEIMKMSPREFSKLPKKQRDALLKRYGG